MLWRFTPILLSFYRTAIQVKIHTLLSVVEWNLDFNMSSLIKLAASDMIPIINQIICFSSVRFGRHTPLSKMFKVQWMGCPLPKSPSTHPSPWEDSVQVMADDVCKMCWDTTLYRMPSSSSSWSCSAGLVMIC